MKTYNKIELTPEGYESLPEEVKTIIDTWNDDKELYKECRRIERELNYIGWSCDYGLSGDINEVWKVNIYNLSTFTRIKRTMEALNACYTNQKLDKELVLKCLHSTDFQIKYVNY